MRGCLDSKTPDLLSRLIRAFHSHITSHSVNLSLASPISLASDKRKVCVTRAAADGDTSWIDRGSRRAADSRVLISSQLPSLHRHMPSTYGGIVIVRTGKRVHGLLIASPLSASAINMRSRSVETREFLGNVRLFAGLGGHAVCSSIWYLLRYIDMKGFPMSGLLGWQPTHSLRQKRDKRRHPCVPKYHDTAGLRALCPFCGVGLPEKLPERLV